MSMTTWRRRLALGLALLAVMAGSSVTALVIGEFALRAFGPRETQYYVWPPHTRRQFIANPKFIGGVSERANFTTNSLGLRGDELPDDSSVFRILVVGGSTTENLYLDDTATWTALLQQKLDPLPSGRRVWVGSAGRSGMSSRDHEVQVERLFEQLPRIDLLLVLVGINDLTVALAQGDTFQRQPGIDEPGVRARREARAFSIVPGGLHTAITASRDAAWWRRTALWQLMARIRLERQKERNQIALVQDSRGGTAARWRSHRANARFLRDSLPPLDVALEEYRENLDSVVVVAARYRVPVALLTQPSIFRPDLDSASARLLWLGGIGDFQRAQVDTYFTVDALSRGMDAFNGALWDLCAARSLPCLRTDAMVPKDTLHFYDDVHFTLLGARKVGDRVSDWLRDSVIPRLP